MADGWVEVFRTHDDMEAELVRGLLKTGNIPVMIEGRGMKSMPYIFGHAAFGQLILKVPPDLADLARELLAAQVEEPEPE